MRATALLFLTIFLLSTQDLFAKKWHLVSGNIYYNHHNQYFKGGMMMDAGYGYVFNRWVGIGASLGMNRAQVNLNDWKKDFLNNAPNGRGFDYPGLSSSILVNITGNFYCIQSEHHHLRLGLGIEYRNISDIVTPALLQLNNQNPYDPNSIVTQSRFENFNDLGLSGNLNYTYFFRKGLGINAVAGYNHYFTDLSKRAYNRETNERYRWGGSSFLKVGAGIVYKF